MAKTTMDELEKCVTELRLMQTMVNLFPQGATEIILEEGDRRTLGDINLSEQCADLKEAIKETLHAIWEFADEVYTNAVDEREGYPECSMAKRALWLDEVQGSAATLRTDAFMD